MRICGAHTAPPSKGGGPPSEGPLTGDQYPPGRSTRPTSRQRRAACGIRFTNTNTRLSAPRERVSEPCVSSFRSQPNLFSPLPPLDQIFVDEAKCIGCKMCAHTAPNTFYIDEEHGACSPSCALAQKSGAACSRVGVAPLGSHPSHVLSTGRARVSVQWADTKDIIEEAVETCPVEARRDPALAPHERSGCGLLCDSCARCRQRDAPASLHPNTNRLFIS